MPVTVETLDKLERRITLTLPAESVDHEVTSRLRQLSRTVKASGFRPGKMPMSVVTQRYGSSVQYEVVNDKVGKAFADAASEAQLRVVGRPRITQRDLADSGQLAFDATFEIYPEVKLGDLAAFELERVQSEVTDEAINKTLDILRKQRRSFSPRGGDQGAEAGDRVTIDFEGKIDGVAFEGGKAENFKFVIGEGQMLETFDSAVRGMKAGESKTFPLKFPDDYQGKDVAGKEADFLVTLKEAEIQHLPEVDETFAKELGINEGTVEALRDDVRKNLQREIKVRVRAKNKAAVMDLLLKASELDVPKALIEEEVERMVQSTRADLKQRGVKDADNTPIPAELFQEQAERRVRLGLVVGELVRAENLKARPDQLQAHLEEMAQSYEKPAEVIRWYLGNRERLAEVEAAVVENNVTDHVLAKARVTDKPVAFDELMSS